MTAQEGDRTTIPSGAINAAALVGRICLGAIFLWGGYGKAMAMTATVGYFTKLGLPLPMIAWMIAVVVELLGGALLISGLFFRPVALVLGAWCLATAVAAHSDFADRNMLIHFLKNLAMFGGFLQATLLGPGAYSIDALVGKQGKRTLTIATRL